MEGADRLYPSIEPYDLEPPQLDDDDAAGGGGSGGEARVCDPPVRWDEEPKEVIIELPLSDSSPVELAFSVDWIGIAGLRDGLYLGWIAIGESRVWLAVA